jgi:hypothetical protein
LKENYDADTAGACAKAIYFVGRNYGRVCWVYSAVMAVDYTFRAMIGDSSGWGKTLAFTHFPDIWSSWLFMKNHTHRYLVVESANPKRAWKKPMISMSRVGCGYT